MAHHHLRIPKQYNEQIKNQICEGNFLETPPITFHHPHLLHSASHPKHRPSPPPRWRAPTALPAAAARQLSVEERAPPPWSCHRRLEQSTVGPATLPPRQARRDTSPAKGRGARYPGSGNGSGGVMHRAPNAGRVPRGMTMVTTLPLRTLRWVGVAGAGRVVYKIHTRVWKNVWVDATVLVFFCSF